MWDYSGCTGFWAFGLQLVSVTAATVGLWVPLPSSPGRSSSRSAICCELALSWASPAARRVVPRQL